MRSSTYLALAVVVLAASATSVAVAQSTCVSQLATCYNDLNSTNPSSQCCNAIRSVVETQLDCLCNLYNNPSVLGGINMTQALMLPKYCNLSSDTSICKASAPGASSLPPPVSPGGNDNAAGRKSWMGMHALLVVLAVISFY